MALATPKLRTADPFGPGAADAPTGLLAGWLAGTGPPEAGAELLEPWHGPGGLHRHLRRWERRATATLVRPPHPLADDPVLAGLDAAEHRRFLAHFRAGVPAEAWSERWAAERHLETLLPSWPVRRWSELRGVHVFLGPTGAGKTTLLFSVAQCRARAGGRVTAVALQMPEAPRRAAFASYAAEAGIDAASVHDATELERLFRTVARSHTILVDTPCLLTRASSLGAALRHPLLCHPRTVLHLCLSLHHGRAVRARALRQALVHRFDCLAVSHLDLAPGGGALVGMQLQGPWCVSFAHASAEPRVPPLPFGAAALRHGWDRGWN